MCPPSWPVRLQSSHWRGCQPLLGYQAQRMGRLEPGNRRLALRSPELFLTLPDPPRVPLPSLGHFSCPQAWGRSPRVSSRYLGGPRVWLGMGIPRSSLKRRSLPAGQGVGLARSWASVASGSGAPGPSICYPPREGGVKTVPAGRGGEAGTAGLWKALWCPKGCPEVGIEELGAAGPWQCLLRHGDSSAPDVEGPKDITIGHQQVYVLGLTRHPSGQQPVPEPPDTSFQVLRSSGTRCPPFSSHALWPHSAPGP